MEDYPRDNLEVVKQDKKNILLTNKDPNLSHLFDNPGPNTPNSVSGEGLNQSGIDVDSGYPDESTEQDYPLFEGHSESYMPDLSPESSQLVLDSNNSDSYNHGNKLESNKSKSHNEASKAHWAEGRALMNARNSPKPHQPVTVPLNKNSYVPVKHQAQRTGSPWNGDQSDPRPRAVPKLHIDDAVKVKVPPSQLVSPPADHYNMQLLALSAQQQQERLREEQQRLQGEGFRQGSSSDALQQLARKAKLRLEEKAVARSVDKGMYEKANQPQSQGLISSESSTLGHVQSRKLPQNVNVSATVGGWTVTDRTMSEMLPAQSKLVSSADVGYPVHDSSILAMQNDRDNPKLETSSRKTSFTIPVTKVTAPQEPELKSPLDHPEHQLDHQQRARFFSGDASNSESVEEGPINEKDKEAALALRELLEQSEKGATYDLVRGYRSSPAVKASLPRPVRNFHEQLLLHNTPPPTYDQAYHAPQAMHHPLRPMNPSTAEAVSLLHGQQPVVGNPDLRTPDIKMERPPSPLPPQSHLPNSGALQGQSVIFPMGSSPGFVIYPVGGQPPALPRHPSPALSFVGPESQYPSISTTGALNNAYLPPASSAALDITSTKIVTPAKATATRDRKSSSSSNSSRRNSDGSLTCGLCGHSFRSTPALNGHMRVHSSSDKKVKEERTPKSQVIDSSVIKANPANMPMQNLDGAYVNIGRSPPRLLAVGTGHAGIDAMPLLSQPYGVSSINQQNQLATRAHNGLLTMASAASYLKTESTHSDFGYQTSTLHPTYVVPHSMVIPPHVLGNIPVNNPEQLLISKTSPQPTYPQLYPVGGQPPFPINLPNVINPQVDVQYVNNQAVTGQQLSMEVNQQGYTPEQSVAGNVKPISFGSQDENYPVNYEQHLAETNSLSQLASIAVAAANRDQLPTDIGLPQDFQQNTYHPPPEQSSQATDIGVGWVNSSGANVQGLPQSNPMYQDASEPKTSPIRTGHDPFFPVTTAQRRLQSRYGEYECQPLNQNSMLSPEPTVTWNDETMLIASYDDPLMREAVNVANPSKILPNSMMGGTPSCGSMFSSSSGRPFRQRHHSEGSHLIKTSTSSILKQILHSPVPTVKLRAGTPDGNRFAAPKQVEEILAKVEPASDVKDVHVNNPAEKQVKIEAPAPHEVWAEPKPIQRRIRRRRHSADSRLILKGGLSQFMRQSLAGSNAMKKPNNSQILRVRHKPPPLVIPSSVNAYTNHYVYQSHLHHRRRPSGDSNSSYNGGADKIPPYTPPPMISPMRAGSGLYCTTPNTPSAKLFRQLSNSESQAFPTIPEDDETNDEDEELMRSSDPKINIGTRFQADIPDMLPKRYAMAQKHKADLVWYVPPQSVAKEQESTKLMEKFMELSCSAVVPHGGANKELALDTLAHSDGNILAAVKKIITQKSSLASVPPRSSKHFLGSGRSWTAQEVKQFDCGMLEHRKDFFIISKLIKTRTTAECVERYYHVVKRAKRRVQRPRRFHGDERPDVMTLLAGSPADVRRAMKTEPQTTSSSSDEEAAAAEEIPFAVPQSLTYPGPQIHKVYSQQGQGHPVSNLASSLPRPPSYAQKPIRTHKARVQASGVGSPSPAGSPASTTSADDQVTQIFTCPVCGKSFAKVKSRNAHMKTHGKQAQEKRRQREEEAARRREESNRQSSAPTHLAMSHVKYLPQVASASPMLHNVLSGGQHSNVHITM